MAELIYDKYKSIFDSVINDRDTDAEYAEPKSLFSNPREPVYPSDELFKCLSTRTNDGKDTAVTPEASGDEAQPREVITEPKGPKKLKKPRQRKNKLQPKQLVMEEGSSSIKAKKQSGKAVISKKKTVKDLVLALQKERIDSQEGTWVECCDPKCRKFRYLDEIKEPWQVPKKWFCSMNKDLNHNSCDAPEEDNTSTDMIFNKFTAGSIVWAKIIGYPWWPAMVDDDPDILNFYYINEELSEEPSHYHVVYLDDKVSRSWVSVSEIKPFSKDKVFSSICGGKDYRNEMKPAFKRALKGLEMTLGDRLRKYSFVSNYKGKWLPCQYEAEDIGCCNNSPEVKNVDNPRSKTCKNDEISEEIGTIQKRKFKKPSETVENLKGFDNEASKKVENVPNKVPNQKVANAKRTVNFTKKSKTIAQKAETESEKSKNSLSAKKAENFSKKTENISKKTVNIAKKVEKLSEKENKRSVAPKAESDNMMTNSKGKSENNKRTVNIKKKSENYPEKAGNSKKTVCDNKNNENGTRKIYNPKKMVNFSKKTKKAENLTKNSENVTVDVETNSKVVNTLDTVQNPSKATENTSKIIAIPQTPKITKNPLKTVENTPKMIQNHSKLIKNNIDSVSETPKKFPSFASFNLMTYTPVTQKYSSSCGSQSLQSMISENVTPESVYRESLACHDEARKLIRELKRMNKDSDTSDAGNEEIESTPSEIPDHMRKQFEDMNELSELVQGLSKNDELQEMEEIGEHAASPESSVDLGFYSNVQSKIETEKIFKKRSKSLVVNKSNGEMIRKRSSSVESVDKNPITDVKNDAVRGGFKKIKKTHVQGERNAKKPIFMVKRKSSVDKEERNSEKSASTSSQLSENSSNQELKMKVPKTSLTSTKENIEKNQTRPSCQELIPSLRFDTSESVFENKLEFNIDSIIAKLTADDLTEP